MLQSISWQTYFTSCIFLLVVYYVVVAVVYYRQDLLSKLNNQSTFRHSIEFSQAKQFDHKDYSRTPARPTCQQSIEIPQAKEFDHKDYQPKVAAGPEINDGNYLPEANDFSELAESAKDELQAFTMAAATQYSKPELATALKKILRRYVALKASSFQISINNVITDECKTNCSTELSDDEVAALWNG